MLQGNEKEDKKGREEKEGCHWPRQRKEGRRTQTLKFKKHSKEGLSIAG